MKQALAILGGVLALSGCISSIPDSGPEARREAELRGQPIVPPSAQSVLPTDNGSTNPDAPGAPLNATGTATPGTTNALSAPTIDAGGTIGDNPSTSSSDSSDNSGAAIGADAMAALQETDASNNTAGSSTMASSPNFDTTASSSAPAQNTISNQDSSGPNLAAYALSVSNRPGDSVYKRSGIKLTSSSKACAKYVSADQAQRAFLSAGGPQKDRLNLDPDGDGFACDWDPTPFQTARQ
ncbi:hypothetical protein [Thioclava nitratireducens]|uniref:hypothetical protein n=1 Tax=Thioclava nitratireducens TaxID=1915078 RepID=UPI0024804C35|nr:hypothetical protein [Thioclava nitratireducens]WGT52210.1 hypothetical protein P0N61_09350 [Thioclava nitratireducens]